jgi:hypothetical protein
MREEQMKTVLAAIGAVSLACFGGSIPVLGGTFTFDLMPAGGSISGAAGSTIGWGYSITNESTTDWLLTVGLSADSFADGTPSLLFDFPTIAPSGTVTVPFDGLAGIGLYQFTWDAAAPVGGLNSGTFVLSAQWWDGVPYNGGNYLIDALDTRQTYRATVSEANGIVPEPSSWVLVLTALGGLFGRKRPGGRRQSDIGD